MFVDVLRLHAHPASLRPRPHSDQHREPVTSQWGSHTPMLRSRGHVTTTTNREQLTHVHPVTAPDHNDNLTPMPPFKNITPASPFPKTLPQKDALSTTLKQSIRAQYRISATHPNNTPYTHVPNSSSTVPHNAQILSTEQETIESQPQNSVTDVMPPHTPAMTKPHLTPATTLHPTTSTPARPTTATPPHPTPATPPQSSPSLPHRRAAPTPQARELEIPADRDPVAMMATVVLVLLLVATAVLVCGKFVKPEEGARETYGSAPIEPSEPKSERDLFSIATCIMTRCLVINVLHACNGLRVGDTR